MKNINNETNDETNKMIADIAVLYNGTDYEDQFANTIVITKIENNNIFAKKLWTSNACVTQIAGDYIFGISCETISLYEFKLKGIVYNIYNGELIWSYDFGIVNEPAFSIDITLSVGIEETIVDNVKVVSYWFIVCINGDLYGFQF